MSWFLAGWDKDDEKIFSIRFRRHWKTDIIPDRKAVDQSKGIIAVDRRQHQIAVPLVPVQRDRGIACFMPIKMGSAAVNRMVTAKISSNYGKEKLYKADHRSYAFLSGF